MVQRRTEVTVPLPSPQKGLSSFPQPPNPHRASTHHPVLLVVVAEHGEAATLPEGSNLGHGIILDGLGHHHDGWVRGTDRKVLVDIAQPPLAGLWSRKE